MTETTEEKIVDEDTGNRAKTSIKDSKLDQILERYTLDEIAQYKEREERVSFPDSFGSYWRDHFTTKDAITSLLQDIKLTDEVIVDINPVTPSPDERLTLFTTTRNINTGVKTKGIVDFITGSPRWEQFIDLTYDSGAHTDLKIIVYDYDSNRNASHPADHSAHISNLTQKNNRCGVRTFLVHAMFVIMKEGKLLKYVIDEGPYTILQGINRVIPMTKPDTPEILPTKRQVQEAEFWVAYNYPYWISRGFETLGSDFDAGSPLGSSVSVDDDLEASAIWDDNGLSIRLTSKGKPDDLYRVWKDGKQTLMDKFPECTIDFKPDSEQGPEITVNVLKIPMSELINMDVEDKQYYGELTYNETYNLEWIVESILAGEEVE